MQSNHSLTVFCSLTVCHLMVLLEDVVHLCHILAADGLYDVAFVTRHVEASPTPSLGFTVQGGTACQRVLQMHTVNIISNT